MTRTADAAPSLALSGWSGSRGCPATSATRSRKALTSCQPATPIARVQTESRARWNGSARGRRAWPGAVDGVQQNLAYRLERGRWCCWPAAVFSNALATAADLAGAGSGTATAPMHGNLLDVMVAVGDSAEGDGLAVMEAMKMEHKLVAEVTGTVVAIHSGAGEQVSVGRCC